MNSIYDNIELILKHFNSNTILSYDNIKINNNIINFNFEIQINENIFSVLLICNTILYKNQYEITDLKLILSLIDMQYFISPYIFIFQKNETLENLYSRIVCTLQIHNHSYIRYGWNIF